MTYECFEVTVDDGVAHIVMNRPEAMNSMNRAFWMELPVIVRSLDADGATRAALPIRPWAPVTRTGRSGIPGT